MSTMVYARFYLNQISVIENLSKSIPVGYKIYVKEHPSMIGRRNRDYYNQIKILPNVKLIDPFIDSNILLKNLD